MSSLLDAFSGSLFHASVCIDIDTFIRQLGSTTPHQHRWNELLLASYTHIQIGFIRFYVSATEKREWKNLGRFFHLIFTVDVFSDTWPSVERFTATDSHVVVRMLAFVCRNEYQCTRVCWSAWYLVLLPVVSACVSLQCSVQPCSVFIPFSFCCSLQRENCCVLCVFFLSTPYSSIRASDIERSLQHQ